MPATADAHRRGRASGKNRRPITRRSTIHRHGGRFAFSAFAPPAHAYEFWLRARTYGQAYQLREYRLVGPDLFYGRRRITQMLALRIFDIGDLAASRRHARLPEGGLRMTWQSYLRIDHDFGDYTSGRMRFPGPIVRDAIDVIPDLAESVAELDLMYGYLQLDGLAHDARVAAIRSVGRAEQRRLYAEVEEFLPLALEDLVPADRGDLETVRHFGRNTLPAFRLFEKRFCRPPGADRHAPAELWGYNHQSTARFTGPGYFVAREDPDRAEVWIDYTRLPAGRAAGWPEIRPNERGLARLVYGFMVDTLRRVSEHVTIGSAAKRGRDIGSWFALCREA